MSPKTPWASLMPAASNFSLNFGRMPVGRRRPCTLPSMYAVCSKTNTSWRTMASPSMPWTSVTLVILRDPSLPRDLHDDVERARDLLLDGAGGQVDAGHEAHGLEPGEHVARRVRVTGRQRADVARAHGLEHRERLATADLTHDHALRAHTEGAPHQVHDRDLALALDVRGA